jgi:lysophospholipase
MKIVITEPRFTKPENLIWGDFKNKRGQVLRTANAPAQNSRGKILLLGGLSEFCEKYFETIRDLNARGYDVITFDWLAQGGSERPLKQYPTRIYVETFDDYADDLVEFIDTYLADEPFFILAHSMGAHHVLKYALHHPNKNILGLILSAPMIAMYAVERVPPFIRNGILKVISLNKTNFVPAGMDWSPHAMPYLSGTPALTSDPTRAYIQHNWMKQNPVLRLGSPTVAWLLASIKSCTDLQTLLHSHALTYPSLIALAGSDFVVSSDIARQQIPSNATILELPKAKHEILMERDDIRNEFLNNIDSFLEKHNQPKL